MVSNSKQVNIDLICGFLGAGKTTLLEHLAKQVYGQEKTVFIQNEFGKKELSVPTESSDLTTEEIRGGCICCSGATVLTQALHQIIEKHHPQRMVVELAQTARIQDMKDLLEQSEEKLWKLQHIIYVVNARSFFSKRLMSQRFMDEQLSQSPLIVINQPQSVKEEELDRMLQAIRSLNSHSCIVTSPWERLTDSEWKAYYDKSGISEKSFDSKKKAIKPSFSNFSYKE